MPVNTDHTTEANQRIETFRQRFHHLYPADEHLMMAQLASFPVAITVHLMYQLWANFNTYDKEGKQYKIPVLCVNDCLLSNLFIQTGSDIYEMPPDVRKCLLSFLRIDRGNEFIKNDLASFLYQYSRINTRGPLWKSFYEAQQWTAIMEVDEKLAAENILYSLVQEKNTDRGIGITNLISTLEKENQVFSGLIQQSLEKDTPGAVKQANELTRRIVITDKIEPGKEPVRINLPPSLSRRLQPIYTRAEAARQVESENRQKKKRMFGLFVSAGVDESSALHIRDLYEMLILKGVLDARDAIVLYRDNAHTRNITSSLDSTLLQAGPDDIVFFCFSGRSYNYTQGNVLLPYDHKDADYPFDHEGISEHNFKRALLEKGKNDPTLIVMLDCNSGSRNWIDDKNSKHFLFAATHEFETVSSGESLFFLSFLHAVREGDDTLTYRELYHRFYRHFIQNFPDRLEGLPLFVVHPDSWDTYIFSNNKKTTIEKQQMLLREAGYSLTQLPTDEEARQLQETGNWHSSAPELEIDYAVHRFMLKYNLGQEADLETQLSRLIKIKKNGTVRVTALAGSGGLRLFNRHEMKQSLAGLQATLHIFSHDEMMQEKFRDILQKLLNTHVLFIGINARATDAPGMEVIGKLLDVAFALQVEVCFVIEEISNLDKPPFNQYPRLPSNIKTEEEFARIFKSLEEILLKEVPALIGSFSKYLGKKPAGDTWPVTYPIFIGVSEYADKSLNLSEPANDALKMKETFAKAGLINEEATLLQNDSATKKAVLDSLAECLTAASRDDVVLVYFGGQGRNTSDHNEIFLYDYDPTSAFLSPEQTGSIVDTDFQALVRRHGVSDPTVVLILDAHAGSRQWLDEKNPKHFCLMATHPQEGCFEIPGEGGVFTSSLLEAVKSGNRGLSYKDLYKYVFERLLANSLDKGRWQTPLFVVHQDSWNTLFSNSRKSDNNILGLQEQLIMAGYPVPETGMRDRETETAIHEFMAKFHITDEATVNGELKKYLLLKDQPVLKIACLFEKTSDEQLYVKRTEQAIIYRGARNVSSQSLDLRYAMNSGLIGAREPVITFVRECHLLLIGVTPSVMQGRNAGYVSKLLAMAFALDKLVYFVVEEPYDLLKPPFRGYPVLPANEKPVNTTEGLERYLNELDQVIVRLQKYQPVNPLDTSRDWAIVIGIDHYRPLGNLKTAESDARAFYSWVVSPEGGSVPPEHVRLLVSSDFASEKLKEQQGGREHILGPDQHHIDSAFKKILELSKQDRQRRLYIYMKGKGASNQGKPCLFLPDITPKDRRKSISIKDYLQFFSKSSEFNEVVVFYDLLPEPAEILSEGMLPGFKGTNQPEVNNPTLLLGASFPNSKNSEKDQQPGLTRLLLQGLTGAAANSEGDITSESLAGFMRHQNVANDLQVETELINYQHPIIIKPARKDGLYGNVGIKFSVKQLRRNLLITDARQMEVANITIHEPSLALRLLTGAYTMSIPEVRLEKTFEIKSSRDLLIDLAWTFNNKWLLVAGTGNFNLSQSEVLVSEAIGKMLADEGYGLITGGWPGVDHVVARSYCNSLNEKDISEKEHLLQIVIDQINPDFDKGTIMRVANDSAWYGTAINRAFAVILIGGKEGTLVTYRHARSALLPVIPVASTEGAARTAFNELREVQEEVQGSAVDSIPTALLDEISADITSPESVDLLARAVGEILKNLEKNKRRKIAQVIDDILRYLKTKERHY